MSIVLFCHARVGMTELLGNDALGAGHRECWYPCWYGESLRIENNNHCKVLSNSCGSAPGHQEINELAAQSVGALDTFSSQRTLPCWAMYPAATESEIP